MQAHQEEFSMHKDSLCPCGSGATYSVCCLPVIHDHQLATTAEMLMRSRYTAFAIEHAPHILKTWHLNTRPKALNFDDNPVVWLGLEVHSSQDGKAGDSSGSVEFTCSYLEKGQLCKLRELSQFHKVDGLWYYLRGECHVIKDKVARNNNCPCGSGKKFKRCCLNK